MSDNGYQAPTESMGMKETGIVPAADVRMPENGLVWMGYLWCILAGAFSPSTSILASMCVGYGTLVLTVMRGERSALTAVGIGCVAATVSSLFVGADIIPTALVSLCSAAVIGIGLGSGKLTSSGACLVAAITALMLLGIDSSLATWAGTNLNDLALEQIDKTFAALSAGMTGLEEGLTLARTIMGILWPTSYTLHAVVGVIAAALGGRVARTGLGALAPRKLTLTTFDPPLWVAGALLVSIVGLAAAQAAPAKDIVLMVSANLLMAVRFAFGVAGVAVAAWLMRRRGMGIVATLLVCAILVFIDMQFFVMAIVGLVDFWANFRHLSRGAERAYKTA